MIFGVSSDEPSFTIITCLYVCMCMHTYYTYVCIIHTIYTCMHVYVCIMYACVCMYALYIRMYYTYYIRIHTCYVLIAQPYHIIRPHAVKDLLNFVLLKFCFVREGTQEFPLVMCLKCLYFFFEGNLFIFLRPAEILLRERGRPRVPPCNVLKMSVFYFFKVITLYFYVLLKF